MVSSSLSALRTRFVELMRRLGATHAPRAAADALIAAYGEPARAYHNVRHLEDCLARLDESTTAMPDRDRVEAALWYHDAIYDPRATDNEDRSATLARRTLTDLGIATEVADDVARLIRLTDHREPAGDPAGRLVCDIDLSILGRRSAEFDAYDTAIRAEYAWVPDEVYRVARGDVLRRLLERDPLFLTDELRRRYEAQARSNLRRALARLSELPA
jgi:predicted metal-dependent HD superfamily phosphohydrolase